MSEENGVDVTESKQENGESQNTESVQTTITSHHEESSPTTPMKAESSDTSKSRSASTKSKRKSQHIIRKESKSTFVPKVVDDVKIGDAKIKYQLVGASSGKELVICLHGLTTYSAHFTDLKEYLVKRRRRQTLLFDFFGRGDSTCPSGKQDGIE